MKKLFATIVVLLSFSFCNELFAGKYSDGYIIKNGDTILCQIRTPQIIQGLCQACLQNIVLTKDTTGKEIEYKSTELDGFGFIYNKEKYDFVPKEIIQGRPPCFVRIILLGKKLNLYSFTEASNTGGTNHYFLEDDRKRMVEFVQQGFNGKRMKEFFSDQPELLALYKQKRPTFWELPDFVNLVNTKM